MSILVKIYLVNCVMFVKVYLYYISIYVKIYLVGVLILLRLINMIKEIMTIDLTTNGSKLWIEVERVID